MFRYTEIINDPQRRREQLEYRLMVAACVPCGMAWVILFCLLFPLVVAGLLISPMFWSKEDN